MPNAKVTLIVTCLLYTLQTQVYAQSGYDEKRGELLYAIYCISCHDSEIHWRDKNLVTDWHTLKEQVNCWQSNLGLDWHTDDIADVTGYLNTVYYHFPVILRNSLSNNDLSLPKTVVLQSDAIKETE